MQSAAPIPAYQIQRTRWLGWASIVCGDLLLALCVFLFFRRVSGHFTQPLGAGALGIVTVAAVAVPAFFRLAWRSWGEPDRRSRMLRLAGPTCGVVLLALAISLPGSSVWGLALLWTGVLASEISWWYLTLKSPAGGSARSRGRTHRRWRDEQSSEAVERPDVPAEAALRLAADVSQQITRARQDGGETVYGLLRCDFEPGERSHNLHVAFCPPLEGKPELAVHQVDGPAVTIKPAQVESFGARLELRLTSKSVRGESVVVEFHAHAAHGVDSGDR